MKFIGIFILTLSLFLFPLCRNVDAQYQQVLRGRYINIPISYSKNQNNNRIRVIPATRQPPIPVQTTQQMDLNNTELTEKNHLIRRNKGRSIGRGMGRSAGGITSVPTSVPTSVGKGIQAVTSTDNSVQSVKSLIPIDAPTLAKHGDPCNPTMSLIKDYCERAQFPHKDRLICAGPNTPGETESYKCVCKYGQFGEDAYIQLRYDDTKKMCLSPAGGECFPRFPTNETVGGDQFMPVYKFDLKEAHEQCDDPVPVDKKGRKLLCAQAHPRRFSHFDQFKYYCLKKEDRAPSEHKEFFMAEDSSAITSKSFNIYFFFVIIAKTIYITLQHNFIES